MTDEHTCKHCGKPGPNLRAIRYRDPRDRRVKRNWFHVDCVETYKATIYWQSKE